MSTGLFIFRRDLRAVDNTGLLELSKICEKVFCIFILDPRQINKKANPYFSANAVSFMLESIKELSQTIPLSILHGSPEQVVEQLIKPGKINVIGFNKDYTPYSVERDNKMIEVAAKYNVQVLACDDVCLNPPTAIKPYKVYTPYYITASKIPVRKPDDTKVTNVIKLPISGVRATIPETTAERQKGGRSYGLQCMKDFDCKSYSKRDMLTYESSRLSPHLKFGTVSCREVYYACKLELFRKQLYWRDFYLQIVYHFPAVVGNNFKGNIKWKNSQTLFKKWCAGKTGYDIVDACMTQLNKTGYMHNRGRMIVANFLTKILHIDWRWGEQYFASKLTDSDVANNNGGWQWSAGTGVDAQPYFRIFNPYTQQEKFDPTGEYVKKWLGDRKKIKEIVDYETERIEALKLVKH